MNQSEELAEYAHAAWCGWTQYMFSKCTLNTDTTMTIPSSLVGRWSRQAYTKYTDLPEDEKESDRDEARKIQDIVSKPPITGL